MLFAGSRWLHGPWFRRPLFASVFVIATAAVLAIAVGVTAAASSRLLGAGTLRAAGLQGGSRAVQSLQSSSTAAGHTLVAEAAYADDQRTIVIIQADSPDLGPSGDTSLIVGGRRYPLLEALRTSAGDIVLTFPSIPRLTDENIALELPTLVSPRGHLAGPWELKFSGSAAVASHHLPLPSPFALTDLKVRATALEASAGTIHLSAISEGKTLTSLTGGLSGSAPKLSISLLDPRGSVVALLTGTSVAQQASKGGPESTTVLLDRYWGSDGPGRYVLEVSYDGQTQSQAFNVG